LTAWLLKFDGILPVLWRDGDDMIYDIPDRFHSLAHLIPWSVIAALEDPDLPLCASSVDLSPFREYIHVHWRRPSPIFASNLRSGLESNGERRQTTHPA
jgi:hypothetical protein